MEKHSGSSKLFESIREIVSAIGRGLAEDNHDYSREMIAGKLFDDAIETLRNRVDVKTIEKTRNKIKALEIYIKAVNETLDEYGYSRNQEFRTTLQKKIDRRSSVSHMIGFHGLLLQCVL